ncbi:MAG: hypothetical protein HN368_10310 [Spirochaetales bacterium]|nr:hypothetical protein [Spirochaetales bacterium]
MKHSNQRIITLFLAGIFCVFGAASAEDNSFSAVQSKIVSLDNWANDIAYSAFGNYVAIASRDNHVRVLSSDLRQIYIHRGRDDYSSTSVIDFTPEEDFLIFLKYESEKAIGVLDLENLEISDRLIGHKNQLVCMDISPDGRFMASGAYKGELIIWHRTAEGFEIDQEISIEGSNILKVVFSPHSNYLAVIRNDDTADLFLNQETGFSLHQNLAPEQHYGNTGYLYGFAFSPDGKQIVSGMRDEITVWNSNNGLFESGQVISEIDHGYVQCIEFTPDGSRFAGGFGRGIIQFWTMKAGEWQQSELVTGKQDYVRSVDFSPAGVSFASGSSNRNTVIFRRLSGVEPDPVMALSRMMGLPYSRAQRSIMDFDIGRELLRSVDTGLSAPKDEFETSEEYAERLTKLNGLAISELQTYTEELYLVSRAAQTTTTTQVEIPLQSLISYSADTGRYHLRVMNESGYIDIPREYARSLKQQWQDSVVVADKIPAPDGYSSNYMNFKLRHPTEDIYYDLFLAENPFRALPVDPSLKRYEQWTIGPHLIVANLTVDDIFPVFYKRYDSSPVGGAEVKNAGELPIESLEISLYIDRYMDNPKAGFVPAELAVGDEVEVLLYALLNNKVLAISEADTLSVGVKIGYSSGGQNHAGEIIRSVRLHDRNAITWDDDRKAAAFVTPKDPSILKYAKRIIGISEESAGYALNKNLLQAMKIFEGMRASGLTYIIDPSSPYLDFSKDDRAVDFLQFPRQTLDYGAGDCDDLSILYNALLESIGIKTAFITVPGHIFTAFNINMHPSAAAAIFSRPESLIFIGDETWVPVETTALDTGFLDAWEIGAGLYSRYAAVNEAYFFTTQEAWSIYEPVGFTDSAEVILPDSDLVRTAYEAQVAAHRETEVYPREEKLRLELSEDKENSALANRLGILYSRYGMYDNALAEFSQILSREEYLPAIMNKGNIHSIRGELELAVEYYLRAAARQPDNPKILLSLTAAYYQSGDLKLAGETFLQVTALDADLAEKYPLLNPVGETEGGSGSRAGSPNVDNEVANWEWE